MAGNRPVKLASRRLAPQPEVVEMLADALKRAKAGEIRSVALAGESVGCGTWSQWATGDGDVAHLVCSIERLKLGLLGFRKKGG